MMMRPKTKSLLNIEQRMEGLEEGSLRYQILASAKNFKSSWIDLGQGLYSVWKDKLYRQWGYQTFDAYTAKELGIKKQTALKLLRSYYFLEKEEPSYLAKSYLEEAEAKNLPNYEAVDALRLAKNKKILDEGDYARFKEEIFEKGKDASEIKRDLTSLIRQREELSPEEAREKRKLASIKRCLSVLKSLKKNLQDAKLLSTPLLQEIDALIAKLETEF